MKRNKIKPKYLNNINKEKNNNIIKKEKDNKINILDNVENKIKNILKTLGLILLLLTFSYIPIIFLAFFGINYNNFSYTSKVIYSFICDIILIIMFISIYKKDIFKDFKNYFNKKFFSNLKTSIKYWLIGLVIMITSNLIITIITNGAIASNEEAVRSLIDKAPLYMLFELVIYAPITEELIFRRSMKDIFKNKYIYIITSGLIFGLMHIITSINSPIELLYLIPYSALGIIFAILYQKTNNIFSTITIHSIHNGLTLILYLITNILA